MILDSFRLDGKVALVTGAAQGLGQGMSIALAQAGADVYTLDRGPCSDTCVEVEKLGRRAGHVACDLREASVADLDRVVNDVVAEMGRLDILINNAGIIRRAACC